MAYIIGLLVVLVAFQEYRIDRLVKRMLLQANIPELYKPTPVSVPASPTPAPAKKGKLLFSVDVPS